jgi:hypothetical protein
VSLVRSAASAEEVARRSWNVLSRPLPAGVVAELTVSTVAPGQSAVLLGRFQREPDAAGLHPGAPRLRRASGGTHVHLGGGDVHVLLSLASADALVACTPASLVNRHVRPVLRALGGAFFGRDWIAGPRELSRRPVAFAGFAHHAGSGRAALEVILPGADGWCDPSRASHRGLAPAHVEHPARFAEAIVSAFEAAFGSALGAGSAAPGEDAPAADTVPWTASLDEAMGPLRAGRDIGGALRFGGEIFASADRVDALGPAVDAAMKAAPADRSAAVGALVDAAFTETGGVIVGVGDLANVRAVLLAACRSPG